MTIRPDIAFQQRTPSVFDALQRGVAAERAARRAPILEALDNLRLQQAQFNAQQAPILAGQRNQQFALTQAQGQQNLQAGAFSLDLQKRNQQQLDLQQQARTTLNIVDQAMQFKTPQERESFKQRLLNSPNMLAQAGIQPQDVLDFPVDDASLNQLSASMKSFLGQDAQQQLTAGQRERADLEADLEGGLDKEGKLKPIKDLTARQLSAARALGVIARPGTSKEERLALDDNLTERVATSQSKIRRAVKQAETEAKSRGEAVTDLTRAEAALPGIEEVVGKLKILSDEATFSLGGKAFNTVAKGFGFSTKGGTSRASMIAIVDNQVLPLLKPIFGAAFTAAEGDRLRNALLDPDATPDSRKAQLDAFLDQMRRNVETKRAELGQAQSPDQNNGSQNADSLRKQAQDAINRGADPAAVNARLQQLLGGQ